MTEGSAPAIGRRSCNGAYSTPPVGGCPAESACRSEGGRGPPSRSMTQACDSRLLHAQRADQVEAVLDARYAQMSADIAASWDGLQRWINGKVLLEDYLYPHVFASAGLSQARVRDLLIEAGRKHIPAELEELARQWVMQQMNRGVANHGL